MSATRLDAGVSRKNVEKLNYSELPQAVQDTIRTTISKRNEVNEQAGNESNMITLDSGLRFENHIYRESYERSVLFGPFYKAGEFFSIGKQHFKIPSESQLILSIIFNKQLYLMGE